MALTYTQWLAANRLPATAQNAANWLATAAPQGTVIPAALRQYFGGAARTGGQQTGTGSNYLPSPLGQAAGPDPLAAVSSALATGVANPAPAPTPVTPAYTAPNPFTTDPSTMLALAAFQGIPGQLNPQYQLAAGQAAASLADYSDQAPTMTPVTVQTPWGPITSYQLAQPDQQGRLYRQGAMGDRYAAASGGDVGSSGLTNALADTQHNLNTQAQQLLQQYAGNVQGIQQQGMGLFGTDVSNLGTALGNWQANQTALASSAGSPQSYQSAVQSLSSPASPSLQPIGSNIGATPTTAKTPAQPTPMTDWTRTTLSPRTLSTRAPSPFQSHWSFSGWGKA
jgi:hypothetical protein